MLTTYNQPHNIIIKILQPYELMAKNMRRNDQETYVCSHVRSDLVKTIGPEIRNDDHQRFIYLIIALADSHGAHERNYKPLHIVMRFLTHRAQDNFFMCMPRCLSQVSRAYVMSVVSFTCIHQISSKHVLSS